MPSKDAASSFGRIGFFLPLTLIFLIAAHAAFACPQHTSRVVYPTRTINSRTVSRMAPVVIAYRGPVSYQGCRDTQYNTRVVKYTRRDNGNYNGPRYVAVSSGDRYYRMPQRRYVAVRNVDLDYAPRYVAVRRVPRYVEPETRFVMVRSMPARTRYVAVRNVDMDMDDDAPRYVAVRKYPVYEDTSTRYVAVRNDSRYYDTGRTKHVAVRSVDTGCSRAVALRGCLDQVETASTRHVVVRTDNLTGKTEVIVPDTNDDTAEYIALPRENASGANYLEYSDAAYSGGSGERFVAVRDVMDPYMRSVAVRTYPEAVNTGTTGYVPVSNYEDVNDQAILDEGGTTYVAADDVGDACLSRMSYRASPMTMDTRAVSYVPVDDVDNVAFQDGSGTTFIPADNAAPAVRYVPVDDDENFAGSDTTFVAADNIGADTVSYVPADNVEYIAAKNVSYVPAESVSYLPAENVSYVPADTESAETATYVPTYSVETVDAAHIADNACPIAVSSVSAEPAYVADNSTVLVEEVSNDQAAGLRSTRRIAGEYGYHDGFKDGLDAALESDVYHPENLGDYRKATNGYEDEFGDKDVYKGAYRDFYLTGYRAGFDSVAGSA